MNLQHERIADSCRQLGLHVISEAWPSLAQANIEQDKGYGDFIEHLLAEELKSKHHRKRTALMKFEGFPCIKIFDEYDFKFASNAPKAFITELVGISFVHRDVNVALLVPYDEGNTY
mgnify:CR=1 FL=1